MAPDYEGDFTFKLRSPVGQALQSSPDLSDVKQRSSGSSSSASQPVSSDVHQGASSAAVDTGSEKSSEPQRDVSEDMRDAALSGGSGGSGSSTESVLDVAPRPAGRPGRRAASGRPCNNASGKTTTAHLQADLVDALKRKLLPFCDQLPGTKATVEAYLFWALRLFDEEVGFELSVDPYVETLSRKIPVPERLGGETSQELAALRDAVADLSKQLKQSAVVISELHGMLVWLMGAKMGAAGTEDALGVQGLHLDFYDAKLLRERVAVQVMAIETERRTKIGRDIEDQVFRNQQAAKK